MTSLSREQENKRMLANLLGIDEKEASQRLAAKVIVTTADDLSSQRIGQSIHAMLDRTVRSTLNDATANGYEVEVIVGRTAQRTDSPVAVHVGFVNGEILVGRSEVPVDESTAHPIFELIAACYAAAMALRLAIGQGGILGGHDSIVVSPRELVGDDLSPLYALCHLDNVVLAGAGAVANGFLYGLKHFKVGGTLSVVDPKWVHDGVLNRCIWFNSDDLGDKKSHALAARARTSFPNLHLAPHHQTLSAFLKEAGGNGLRQVVTTVDSRRARRNIQGEIPHETYDASTTGISEVVLHFNLQPSDLACLACIYREDAGELQHERHVAEALGVTIEEVKREFIDLSVAEKICQEVPGAKPMELVGKAFDTVFKERCAEGLLKTAEDRQVLAPFCVVSMLAGAYLALEFVRRLNSGNVVEPFNYWRLSPWHRPQPQLRQRRARLQGCPICGDRTIREVTEALWGERLVVMPTASRRSQSGEWPRSVPTPSSD